MARTPEAIDALQQIRGQQKTGGVYVPLRGTVECYPYWPQSALRLDRGYPFNQPLRGWCAAHSEITYPLNIYVTQHASRLTLHVHVLLWCLEEVHYMANP